MKLIFRIALIILLTFGVITTEKNFLKKPIFEIKNIKIEGASEKLETSFTPLKEQLIGKNINDINIKEIEKRISQDVRIKNVSVIKTALNEIAIKVEEREPKYYLQYKKNIYILDKDGIIYNYLNDLKTKDFPFIVAKSEEEIQTLLEVLDKVEATDFRDIISQIYMESENCINLILSNGVIIKTNKEVTKEKYDTGSYLFFDLSSRKKIDYMDLRYEDYIIKYMEDKNGK
ncbi:cell division protein FtsQ/DivIB [Fusobacterium sp.]|uniref:cell division protein FtsQ/DivIB n=1 Tax=Fusobacterium sp. TaxID=68766 RepID=UPI002603CD4E|nr:cell division protein FtsQ/DivIB [Fusobacterium sp.]